MSITQAEIPSRPDRTPEGREILGSEHLTIPGKGQAHERCGEWRAEGYCDGAARGGESHVILRAHECGRRECPECWSRRWAKERTVAAVARLGAVRYHAERPIEKRAVHAVVSPPQEAVESVSDLYRYRSEAVGKARDHGVRGGLMVPHAFRVAEGVKREFKEAKNDGEEDAETGIWRWVRENSRPWREQVEFSPHYHVVGLAEDVEAGDGSEGWVVKNIEHGDSYSLAPFRLRSREGYEDMASVVRYLLSHATFEEDGDRQAVTWFGAAHGTNFNPEEELTLTAWRTIQRRAEEIVGTPPDELEESEGGDDEESCPAEGCEGEVQPMGTAGDFLSQHRSDMEELNIMALRTAYRWHLGELEPPPGLREPRCREDAEAGLMGMLQARCAGTVRWEKMRSEHGSGEAVLEAARERYLS